MFRKFLDWLDFKLNHVHEMYCTGYDESLTSSERWYWHVIECRYCDHTEKIMTAGKCQYE